MSVLGAIKGWKDDACGVDSLGCAAYMTFEEQLERDLFDDDLGSLAREYVGQHRELAGRHRPPGQAGRPLLGQLDHSGHDRDGARHPGRGPRRRRCRPPFVAGRRSFELDLGPNPYHHVPRGHPGRERDRAARVVFRQGPLSCRRRGRRGRCHLLPVQRRLRRSVRQHDHRQDRPALDLRDDEHAHLPLRHRHGRPRRRPDRDHDGAVGQPERSPLRRPDRRLAGRPRRCPCLCPAAVQKAARWPR